MQNICKLSETYEHRQVKQEIQYHESPPSGNTSSASSSRLMLKNSQPIHKKTIRSTEQRYTYIHIYIYIWPQGLSLPPSKEQLWVRTRSQTQWPLQNLKRDSVVRRLSAFLHRQQFVTHVVSSGRPRTYTNRIP